MRNIICIISILISFVFGIAASTCYFFINTDFDSEFGYSQTSVLTIKPEGTKETVGGNEVLNWQSYESAERIEFSIDKDMANEIGKAIITSCVWNTINSKKVRRNELKNMFTYSVIETDLDLGNSEKEASYKITAKQKRFLNDLRYKSMDDMLENYKINKEIKVFVSKEDGRTLEICYRDNKDDIIIDERAALEIATSVLKRKGILDLSDIYTKDKSGAKWKSLYYIYSTYGSVLNVMGQAHQEDTEQAYYSVSRIPRFSDVSDNAVYTYRPLNVLIRKSDGKIEKCWLSEGIG